MKLNFKNYSIDVKLEKMLSNCASNMDMTKTRSKEQLNKVWEHRINQWTNPFKKLCQTRPCPWALLFQLYSLDNLAQLMNRYIGTDGGGGGTTQYNKKGTMLEKCPGARERWTEQLDLIPKHLQYFWKLDKVYRANLWIERRTGETCLKVFIISSSYRAWNLMYSLGRYPRDWDHL